MHEPGREGNSTTNKRKRYTAKVDKYVRERLTKFSNDELLSLYLAMQDEMSERGGDSVFPSLPTTTTQKRYYELYKIDGSSGDSTLLFRIPSDKLSEEEVGHLRALENAHHEDVFRDDCPRERKRAYWYVSSCIGEYDRETLEWTMTRYGDPSAFSLSFVDHCVEAMNKWKEFQQENLSYSANDAYLINFCEV